MATLFSYLLRKDMLTAEFRQKPVLRSMSKPFKHPSFNIHTEKKHFRSSHPTISLKNNIKKSKKHHKNTVDIKNYDHS